jgi:hypothetical protein
MQFGVLYCVESQSTTKIHFCVPQNTFNLKAAPLLKVKYSLQHLVLPLLLHITVVTVAIVRRGCVRVSQLPVRFKEKFRSVTRTQPDFSS